MNVLERILKVRQEEKKYTLQVLEYLEIIDREKLYVDKGYSSLFSYCVEELDYSKAEAAIRVNATRLIKSEPQAKKMIKDNELSLTNASLIQSFFKQEKLDSQTKKEVINSIKNKSKRETQKIILDFSTTKRKELKLILNERLLTKLEKVQKILGDVTELEALEILLDQKIREKELDKKTRKERGSKRQRYIPRRIKQEVFKRDKQECQNCHTKLNLQLDHVRPIHLGGVGRPENLQVLCFSCNQRKYIKFQMEQLVL